MFDPFEKAQDESFSWEGISNIKEGRENLGEQMPVLVYRLFQYAIKDELTRQLGKDAANDIFRKSGKRAGIEFSNNVLDNSLPFAEFIAHLQQVLIDHKIGVLRVEKFNSETGEAVLTVGEDLDCSGLPITGETVCTYDEGFLAGILQVYTKNEYIVTEIDCWATGARVCRFEAKISGK